MESVSLPLFGLEVGEELKKRWNREICGQEMDFVYDLDWKKKKKGLFGAALILTTSHFEVLVIEQIHYFMPPPPPFVNPGSTTA